MELISAILSIVVIDLALSGDNAVVIGMAAHRLPPKQRRLAIVFGGGAAIVLRVTLTAVATLLLLLPALKAIGGALLLWIAYKLLKQEEESAEGMKIADSMRAAILTILLADFIMSLDNILGVAAAARGNVELLIFGLMLSMGILMIGGSIVAELLNRLWWLSYLGSGVIAWTGTEMFLRDELVDRVVALPDVADLLITAVVTVAVLGAAHYFHRHLPARRALAAQSAAGTTSERAG
ncbi:MAG: YjbE family putative metal transport protein [Chloroflexi bacterium]|nr:YjbE family putative metal transport protein [Chloroflexota bacterium]